MITTLPSDAVREKSANPVAVPLCSGLARIPRSEPRATLSALLWITSLHKPGAFEIVPTENVSRMGIQLVTQKFWEPDELALVSSPPGLCLQDSAPSGRALPSDVYVLAIPLSAPVE